MPPGTSAKNGNPGASSCLTDKRPSLFGTAIRPPGNAVVLLRCNKTLAVCVAKGLRYRRQRRRSVIVLLLSWTFPP
jgi:hypothetical protein